MPATTEANSAIPTTDLADLKRKSVRGGMITFASQGASVVIQLTSTVILARLLSPDDYGVMAMVMAVTAFAGLFRDLGLSAAAIQKQTLTPAQQSNLFWINVALGCTLTVLLAAASPLVAWFYGKPEVLWVTMALSASFMIGSVSAQSGALLVREMRFGRQAVPGIAGALVTLAVAVTLALQDFRYWSLVWGQLAGALTTTTLLFMLSPFRPGLPSRGTGLKAMLEFGANITAFDFVNYFHRNLDNILIGRFWGTEMLGFYSRAYALLMFPINNLRGPINAVAFPAMSKLQNEPEAFRAYYRRVVSIVAALSMPVCAFLFVAAQPLIEIALGERWLESAVLFQVLAIVGLVQPSASLRGLVVMSLGDGRKYLKLGILQATFTSIGFLVGIRWGAMGVAISYVVSTYAVLYPMFRLAFKGTPLRPLDYLGSVAIPFAASVVGALCATILMKSISEGRPAYCYILVTLPVFTLVTLLVFVITPVGRGQFRDILGYIALFRRRG